MIRGHTSNLGKGQQRPHQREAHLVLSRIAGRYLFSQIGLTRRCFTFPLALPPNACNEFSAWVRNKLIWNSFRDHLILEYEIPKYDGDLGQPNFFVHLEKTDCQRKITYLLRHFQSQVNRRYSDLF